MTSFLFKQHSFINKNHVKSPVHLSHRLKIVEALLLDRQRVTQQGEGFDYYVGQLKKLSQESFPFDMIYPAVTMCTNANISE